MRTDVIRQLAVHIYIYIRICIRSPTTYESAFSETQPFVAI